MAKRFKRTLGGLIFPPLKSIEAYYGLQQWYEANCPDNVYIYDLYDALINHNIPIVDAVRRLDGIMIRIPRLMPKEECLVTRSAYSKQLPRKGNKVKGIYFSNPKIKKNKMVK